MRFQVRLTKVISEAVLKHSSGRKSFQFNVAVDDFSPLAFQSDISIDAAVARTTESAQVTPTEDKT